MMGWMAPLRHLSAKLLSDRISSEWEPSMGEVTTIGLDLAKHVFQVHGVDAEGGQWIIEAGVGADRHEKNSSIDVVRSEPRSAGGLRRYSKS